jgi:hypothetical protein
MGNTLPGIPRGDTLLGIHEWGYITGDILWGMNYWGYITGDTLVAYISWIHYRGYITGYGIYCEGHIIGSTLSGYHIK